MGNLTVKKNYLTNNRCYQRGETCEKIGIQIHTIGTGQGTAASVAAYWNPACGIGLRSLCLRRGCSRICAAASAGNVPLLGGRRLGKQ